MPTPSKRFSTFFISNILCSSFAFAQINPPPGPCLAYPSHTNSLEISWLTSPLLPPAEEKTNPEKEASNHIPALFGILPPGFLVVDCFEKIAHAKPTEIFFEQLTHLYLPLIQAVHHPLASSSFAPLGSLSLEHAASVLTLLSNISSYEPSALEAAINRTKEFVHADHLNTLKPLWVQTTQKRGYSNSISEHFTAGLGSQKIDALAASQIIPFGPGMLIPTLSTHPNSADSPAFMPPMDSPMEMKSPQAGPSYPDKTSFSEASRHKPQDNPLMHKLYWANIIRMLLSYHSSKPPPQVWGMIKQDSKTLWEDICNQNVAHGVQELKKTFSHYADQDIQVGAVILLREAAFDLSELLKGMAWLPSFLYHGELPMAWHTSLIFLGDLYEILKRYQKFIKLHRQGAEFMAGAMHAFAIPLLLFNGHEFYWEDLPARLEKIKEVPPASAKFYTQFTQGISKAALPLCVVLHFYIHPHHAQKIGLTHLLGLAQNAPLIGPYGLIPLFNTLDTQLLKPYASITSHFLQYTTYTLPHVLFLVSQLENGIHGALSEDTIPQTQISLLATAALLGYGYFAAQLFPQNPQEPARRIGGGACFISFVWAFGWYGENYINNWMHTVPTLLQESTLHEKETKQSNSPPPQQIHPATALFTLAVGYFTPKLYAGDYGKETLEKIIGIAEMGLIFLSVIEICKNSIFSELAFYLFAGDAALNP